MKNLQPSSHIGRRRRGPASRSLLSLVPAIAAPLLLCSCESVTYDMRQMQQPVVLNQNPFVAGLNSPGCALSDVDTYTAKVMRSHVAASSGNAYATTTTSSYAQANAAQVAAFEKIGGQNNRTIRNISLNVEYLAINALLALGEQVSIDATGDVAEFAVPVPAVTKLEPLAAATLPAAASPVPAISGTQAASGNQTNTAPAAPRLSIQETP